MDPISVQAQQDALRPLRMFVGALSGALIGAEQSNAAADGYAWNMPGGYQTVGPYTYSAEGRPIAATAGGGLYISPMLVFLGIGAAVVYFAKG
jgi:hypothetical protein